MHRALYIGSLFLLLLPAACKKGGCNVVPYVPVNRIPFSTTEFPELLNVNGSIVLPGGYAGIIVFNTGSRIVAYDRCSTVDPGQRHAVEASTSNPFVAVDPYSKAEFFLMDGSPSNLAECPLKSYAVEHVGGEFSPIYYIVN